MKIKHLNKIVLIDELIALKSNPRKERREHETT